MPFSRVFFGWEGSLSKIDYRKKRGTLILSSKLEDLDEYKHFFYAGHFVWF